MAGPSPTNGIRFYDMPDYTGDSFTSHVVLAIPPSFAYDHISSLTLFLEQLLEAANKETREIYLTVFMLDGTREALVQLKKLDETSFQTIIQMLIEYRLKPKDESRGEESFSWDVVAPAFSAEPAVFGNDITYFEETPYTIGNRIVFLFQPEETARTYMGENKKTDSKSQNPIKNPLPGYNADFVEVRFKADRDEYPLGMDTYHPPVTGSESIPSVELWQRSTAELLKSFTPLSPCEMYKRFVHAIQPYEENFGIAALRVFDSSVDSRHFFVKDAIRAVEKGRKEGGFDPLVCNAEVAFKTAEQLYFFGNDFSYPYDNNVDNKKALSLFIDNHDGPPERDEVAGVASGYYELLRELGRVKGSKAGAYFLHHILRIHFSDVPGRIDTFESRSVAFERSPYIEETALSYLRDMNVLPTHLFEALFDFDPMPAVRSLFSMLDSCVFELTANYSKEYYPDSYFWWQSPAYETFFKDLFRPIVSNFSRLSRDEQDLEFRKVVGYVRKYIADVITPEGESKFEELFIMALDNFYDALRVRPDLAERLTHEIVMSVVSVKGEELNDDSKPNYNIIYYLRLKGLLSVSDSVELIRWSFGLSGLEWKYHLMGDVLLMAEELWPSLDATHKGRVRAYLVEAVIPLMERWIVARARGEVSYDKSNLYFEDVAGFVVKIQELPDLEKYLVRLVDSKTVVFFDGYSYLSDTFKRIFETRPFDEWLHIVEFVISNSENGWKMVPFLLGISKKHERRAEVLAVVEKALRHYQTSFQKLFDRELFYITEVVRAYTDEDPSMLFSTFESVARGGFSNKMSELNQLLGGYYLTDKIRSALLLYLLVERVEMDGSPDEATFDAFAGELVLHYSFDQNHPILSSYDDAVHGDAWERVFFYKDMKFFRSSMLATVFGRMSRERQERAVDAMMERIRSFSWSDEKKLGEFLGIFSHYYVEIKDASTLMRTASLFDFLSEGLKSGKLNPSFKPAWKFALSFYYKWYNMLDKLSFEEQCRTFVYLVGPLLVLHEDGLNRNVIVSMIIRGILGDPQDREKALRLGVYLASSPHIGSLMSIFEQGYFDMNGLGGLIEGFIRGYEAKKASLEPGSMAARREKSIMMKFVISGLKKYRKEYSGQYFEYVAGLSKRISSSEYAILALQPIRDEFYEEVKERGAKIRPETYLSLITQLLCLIKDKEIQVPIRRAYLGVLDQLNKDMEEMGIPLTVDMREWIDRELKGPRADVGE